MTRVVHAVSLHALVLITATGAFITVQWTIQVVLK